jgi:hypothetical protein
LAATPGTSAAPAEAERYFSDLKAAFDSAASRTGAIDYTLTVGPWTVGLTFAGDELLDVVVPALGDVKPASAVDPSATLCIFDSASTGVDVPPFAWRPVDLRPRGEVAGYNDDRFRTIYHGDVLREDGGFDALSMFDEAERTGVFWVSSLDRVDWWERAEPLRSALHWALGGERRHLAHAAGVGDERGAVLLAGAGGAGKTTTTVACLLDGLQFVGDNYVLLSQEGAPVVHGIYHNVKLRPATLELLPELASAVRTFDVEEGEKLIVDVGRWRPAQVASGLPVRALLVPEVRGHGETRVVPASPVETLLALAPTTIYQLPNNGGALSAMSELVRQVPTFRLELGGDVADGPAAIRELLDSEAGPA